MRTFWVGLAVLGLLFVSRPLWAVQASDFQYRNYTDADGTTPYRLYVPGGYVATTKYPLVLFLHGVGENGNDNNKQLNNRANGAMALVELAGNPAFMIAPQNWNGASGWGNDVLRRHILRIIQSAQGEFNIDVDRIYISGLSNGGAGTWDQINTYPWLYAAAVPICGWGSASEKMKDIPIWCFHAANDGTVGVASSDNAVNGVRNLGGNPIYTRYATGGHASWTPAYQTTEMIQWLYVQRRGQREWSILPDLNITAPTASKGFNTTAATVTLSGTATDVLPANASDTGITSLAWTNSAGSLSGACTGTTAWDSGSIALSNGMNRIRIIATGTPFKTSYGGNTTWTDVLYVARSATADSTVPTITITQPNTTPVTVTASPYTMAATASDNIGVVDFLWSSDRGYNGTCQNQFPVPLLTGANVITLRAVDAAGNQTTRSVTINYSPLVGNQPPNVNAGFDRTIVWTGNQTPLDGTIIDDGLAPGNTSTTAAWSKVSGPGTVTFGNASAVDTTATFSAPGLYVLRLTGSDGQLSASDDVNVSVAYKRWLFDLGDTTNVTTGNWNNVSTSTSGVKVTGALDSTGATTGVGLEFPAAFTAINSNGTATATLYPATAQQDSFYVQAATVARVKLTGLNAALRYRVQLFASRMTFDDRTTEYTYGATKLVLDPVDNTQRSVAFDNIQPDSAGAIEFSVAADGGTGYGYLGVVDVLEMTVATGGDTTAPTVAITAPTSNATHSTTTATLNIGGTASDAVGVTQVTWANNRGGSGTATGTTNWTVGGITLLSGSNILTVTARDAAGNTATDTLTVTYTPPDTTAPTVAITTPTSNATHSTTTATLNIGGTASDAVGVTQVTWANNRGGSGTATGTTNWTVSGITLLSGSNILTVTARDAAGNTATDTLAVTYTPPDTTAPVITITTPVNAATLATSSSALSLGGTASDAVGVTQVSWSNDRGGSGTATGTTSWTVGGLTLVEGLTTFTVTARDAAGNTSTDSIAVTYTRPNTAPAITSGPNAMPNPALVNETVSFSGTASDAEGDPVTFAWDFGDGTTAAGANAVHSYGVSGTYTATLTVSDNRGGSASGTVSVTVNDPAPPETITVNFQMSGSATPADTLPDTGAVFGDRGNGYSYGWNADNSAQTRDRNAANSPDQRFDTLTHLQKPANPDAVWEIALPNGSYTVHIVSGDPSYFDSVYKLAAEGILTVDGTPSATVRWLEGTSTVTVADGRLTVSNAAGGVNNKICFIEITPAALARFSARGTLPVAEPLTVTKLQLGMNFAKPGADRFSVSGDVPGLPVDFKPLGVAASIDVGAAMASAALDAKGRGKSAKGGISLKFQKKKGWRFSAVVKKSDCATNWADGGLTNATVKLENVELPVTLTLGERVFGGSRSVDYAAKEGKGSSAK